MANVPRPKTTHIDYSAFTIPNKGLRYGAYSYTYTYFNDKPNTHNSHELNKYKATVTKKKMINCDTCNRPISPRTMVWKAEHTQETICHACYSRLHAKFK
jgi:hypothetical protein